MFLLVPGVVAYWTDAVCSEDMDTGTCMPWLLPKIKRHRMSRRRFEAVRSLVQSVL